ncbi:hypothetical protein LXL04_012857 [Taraxacum kok-saghyz]
MLTASKLSSTSPIPATNFQVSIISSMMETSLPFDAITPSQFITFEDLNPLNHCRLLHTLQLRVAVLDSPTAKSDDESPVIATMIVPENMETDWNFCTESGHINLLFKFENISRLILIGNTPPPDQELDDYRRPPDFDPEEREMVKDELKPLIRVLHPKVSFNHGLLPEPLFVIYDDNVAYRVTIAKFTGPIVGEFLVEDVELVGNQQLRRRMRFKRTPNLIQSEVILHPFSLFDITTPRDLESLRNNKNVTFEINTRLFVHQYLIAMVSGLSVISSYLNKHLSQMTLCLGIGGGVLLNFLLTQMGSHLTGVEADPMVLEAARRHFGFNKSGPMEVFYPIVGDAIEYIQRFPRNKHRFQVVFVDLDASEANNEFRAPPPEFVKKSVLQGLRFLVSENGVLIMNVVPLNEVLYVAMIEELKEIFHKVYEIDLENEENFVVIATPSADSSSNVDDRDNKFLKKLRSVIPGTYLNSIVEL